MDHLDLNLLFSLQALEHDVIDDCILNKTNTKECNYFAAGFHKKTSQQQL